MDDIQLRSIDLTKSSDIIKSKYKTFFESSLKNSLNECISEQKKLRTYAQFKSVLKLEPYLIWINIYKIRKCYLSFRLGVHDLEIERGRYTMKSTPKDL